jgi:hypothetical protein
MDYVSSQKTRIWSKENCHAAHETPFHPSVVECGVQCLAVRSLCQFSSKTQLTRRATLISPCIPWHILTRELPKRSSNTTAQHVVQHGRPHPRYAYLISLGKEGRLWKIPFTDWWNTTTFKDWKALPGAIKRVSTALMTLAVAYECSLS